MPAIQGRTRKQLRQAVGFNLGAIHTGTAYDAGSNTTLISLTFVGGDDSYNGKWIVVADTTNSDNTEFRIISDYTASAYRVTLQQALSFATAAGDTYEIWDEPYIPDAIHEFINQAIVEATGKVYDPIENISLHGDGRQTRYDIPSGISQISKIEYRNKISFTKIHDCGTTFDESTDNEMSQKTDSKDFKLGGSSLQLTTSAGDGSFISDSITSKDISGYTHLEGWVKAKTAIAASDVNICLDNATCTCDGNDLETLPVPAIAGNTWTFFRVALNNPELDIAIVSVGIEYNANSKTNVLNFDGLRVVKNDTAEWATLDRRLWKIDKEARDLILLRDGQDALGYSLIKIVGGDKPALLSAETDATEIPEDYIVAFATTRALLANSGGASTDPDSRRQQAGYWDGVTNRAKQSMTWLVNVRKVD